MWFLPHGIKYFDYSQSFRPFPVKFSIAHAAHDNQANARSVCFFGNPPAAKSRYGHEAAPLQGASAPQLRTGGDVRSRWIILHQPV